MTTTTPRSDDGYAQAAGPRRNVSVDGASGPANTSPGAGQPAKRMQNEHVFIELADADYN